MIPCPEVSMPSPPPCSTNPFTSGLTSISIPTTSPSWIPCPLLTGSFDLQNLNLTSVDDLAGSSTISMTDSFVTDLIYRRSSGSKDNIALDGCVISGTAQLEVTDGLPEVEAPLYVSGCHFVPASQGNPHTMLHIVNWQWS